MRQMLDSISSAQRFRLHCCQHQCVTVASLPLSVTADLLEEKTSVLPLFPDLAALADFVALPPRNSNTDCSREIVLFAALSSLRWFALLFDEIRLDFWLGGSISGAFFDFKVSYASSPFSRTSLGVFLNHSRTS